MSKKMALDALTKLCGTAEDPNNGWRGHAKTSSEHFACEYCGVEHLDCVELPHAENCPVLIARAAIAALQAEPQPEPVAQIVGTGGTANMPLLQWLSADHSFRAPIGSMLYALPATPPKD